MANRRGKSGSSDRFYFLGSKITVDGDYSHERCLLLGRKAMTNLVHVCMQANSLQLCPTLCYPMDCSPSGSSIYGILQARILELPCPPSGDPPDLGLNPSLLRILYCKWILYH